MGPSGPDSPRSTWINGILIAISPEHDAGCAIVAIETASDEWLKEMELPPQVRMLEEKTNLYWLSA